jgi:hypothetical protein
VLINKSSTLLSNEILTTGNQSLGPERIPTFTTPRNKFGDPTGKVYVQMQTPEILEPSPKSGCRKTSNENLFPTIRTKVEHLTIF